MLSTRGATGATWGIMALDLVDIVSIGSLEITDLEGTRSWAPWDLVGIDPQWGYIDDWGLHKGGGSKGGTSPDPSCFDTKLCL